MLGLEESKVEEYNVEKSNVRRAVLRPLMSTCLATLAYLIKVEEFTIRRVQREESKG